MPGILFIPACPLGCTLENVSCQTAARSGGTSFLSWQHLTQPRSPFYAVTSPSRQPHTFTHSHILSRQHTNICCWHTWEKSHMLCLPICSRIYDGWSCEGPFHLWTHSPSLPPCCQDTVFTVRWDIRLKISPSSSQVTYVINNNFSFAVDILDKSYLFAWAVGIYRLTGT